MIASLYSVVSCALALVASAQQTPGARIVGLWQAWYIGTSTQLVVVRNEAHSKIIPTLQAVRVDPDALKKSFFLDSPQFLYFGDQPAVEFALDEACKLAAANPGKLPPKSVTSVIAEYVDASFAKDFVERHGDYAPFLGGSLFTAIAPLTAIEKAAEKRLNVAAAVASCKDPAGSRFKLAQQRGYHFHMRDNLWSLRDAISRYINSRVADTTDDVAKEVVKAKALELALKACNSTLNRLRKYEHWLKSNEPNKKAQVYVQFDAPVSEDTQWYAKVSREKVEKQRATLLKEYKNGQSRVPSAYPVLYEEDSLTSEDFKVLFETS